MSGFHPSWLQAAPQGPAACGADVPYVTIDAGGNTFQCHLCGSAPLELTNAKRRRHFRSVKHFKRYGLLMKTYRAYHGLESDGAEEAAQNATAESTPPVAAARVHPPRSERRRYPEAWLHCEPLPAQFEYQGVPYCERTFDIHAKTLRWRCRLCDSGWIGNNDRDAAAHCQGNRHAKRYEDFRQAHMDRQAERSAAVKKEAERLRRMQKEAERNEIVENPTRNHASSFSSSNASSAIVTAPSRILIDPGWLEHPQKGQLAYNNVPYGQIKMEANGLAKWRCLLCQSGWMPASDPFPLRHCQGRTHATNYNSLQEAARERHAERLQEKSHSTGTEVKGSRDLSPEGTQSSSSSTSPLAAPVLKILSETASNRPAAFAIRHEPIGRNIIPVRIDPAWIAVPPPGKDAYENVAYGEARTDESGARQWRCLLCDCKWMSANDKDRPRHTQGQRHVRNYQKLVQAYEARLALSFYAKTELNTDSASSQIVSSRPKIVSATLHIHDDWLKSPPPSVEAYDNVIYGETRFENGSARWRCRLCNSNWMSANDKDRPRHTSGAKHKKNFAKLLEAYRSYISPTQTDSKVTASPLTIDDSWLSEPPRGQLAYENVPYGELRLGDTGEYLWKCWLCSSDWMVATDENRLQHCRSARHAVIYRQLVVAFEDRHLEDSAQESDGDTETSEASNEVPCTLEQTQQAKYELDQRWGDMTSEAFTAADDDLNGSRQFFDRF